jgi:hypothetical protein
MPKSLLYNARVRRESELPAFAGVTFVLRKMSEKRRTALRESLFELEAEYMRLLMEASMARAQLDQYVADVNRERAERSEDPLPSEQIDVPEELAGKFADLEFRVRNNQAEQDHVFFLWGIQAIEGFDLISDGSDVAVAATPESLYEDGPRELFMEGVRFVKQAAGLTVNERKNSSPPSTSTPEDGGHDESTSATSATPNDSF